MSGCVYLIESRGRFSIGMAEDVQAHIRSLQSGGEYSEEFSLLCAVRMTDPAPVVATLHQQYEAKRVPGVPGVSEHWFSLTHAEANEVSAYLLCMYFEESNEVYRKRQADEVPAFRTAE